MTDLLDDSKQPGGPASPGAGGSTAAQALAAAGDARRRRTWRLDDSAAAAQTTRLDGRHAAGLVERFPYGRRLDPDELGSGARIGTKLSREGQGRRGRGSSPRTAAFEADSKLSAAPKFIATNSASRRRAVPDEHLAARSGATEALAVVEEELAANGLGALAVEVSGELTIGAGSLLAYGTDAQKSTFLPMLSEGA